MDEPKHIPFPNIAHFPGEELSPGMPKTPEESVFLSTPELAHTATIAVEYAQANSKTRNQIETRTVKEILENPERIEEIFDAIAIFKETGGYTKIQEFEEVILQKIDKAELRELKPEATLQLLSLTTHSALYGPIAEKLLSRHMEQCVDTQSFIHELYILAGVGIASGDRAIVKKTLEVLRFQTSIMPSDSNAAILFQIAQFDRNDATLRYTMEIDSLSETLTLMYFPEIKAEYDAHTMPEIQGSARFKAISKEYFNGYDPKRFAALAEWYNTPVGEHGSVEIPSSDLAKFPHNLIMNAGPLRELQNSIFTQKLQGEGKSVVNICLPYSSSVCGDCDRAGISDVIYAALHLNTPATKDEAAMEGAKYWKTLSYLLPESAQSEECLRALGLLNDALKEEMRDHTNYLLNPRGDTIEIKDRLLRSLGFRSITYQINQRNRRDTLVSVAVGNFIYSILLDEFFNFRTVGTRANVSLPPEGSFLEHIIVSHLREIRCANKTIPIANPAGGEGAEGHPVHSRRPHRRELPENQNPTPEQIRRAREVYDIDIIRWNREAAARGNTRRFTFVFEVESEITGLPPVRSQAPNATNQLNMILGGFASTAGAPLS